MWIVEWNNNYKHMFIHFLLLSLSYRYHFINLYFFPELLFLIPTTIKLNVVTLLVIFVCHSF